MIIFRVNCLTKVDSNVLVYWTLVLYEFLRWIVLSSLKLQEVKLISAIVLCADQLLPGRGAQLGPLDGGAGARTGRGGARAAGFRARAARAHCDKPGQPDWTGANARRHRRRHSLRAPTPSRHLCRRGCLLVHCPPCDYLFHNDFNSIISTIY